MLPVAGAQEKQPITNQTGSTLQGTHQKVFVPDNRDNYRLPASRFYQTH
jgi:hypothetical protein